MGVLARDDAAEALRISDLAILKIEGRDGLSAIQSNLAVW